MQSRIQNEESNIAVSEVVVMFAFGAGVGVGEAVVGYER